MNQQQTKKRFNKDCVCDVENTLSGSEAPSCGVGNEGGVVLHQQSRPQLRCEFLISPVTLQNLCPKDFGEK